MSRIGRVVLWSAVSVCTVPVAAVLGQGVLSFTDIGDSAGVVAMHNPPIYNPTPTYFMSGGGTVGDFNGDGWQDLYWLGTGGDADKLFINQQDGTFVDEAASWGLANVHAGVGAAAADYDNDGDIDIFVTSHSPNGSNTITIGQHRLYQNKGDGSFEDVAVIAGVSTTSLADADGWSPSWGDYDSDGDLDLAIAGWKDLDGSNKLFRNDGDGTFTDVTGSVMPASLRTCRGFTPRFCDMDHDGHVDLLWVSDFRTSKYFLNNGDGTFSQGVMTGTGLDVNGMGTCVGDFNDDGLPDWYVTSIFYTSIPPQPPFVNGNAMYLNNGGHSYSEVAGTVGAQDGAWGWGSDAIDFNHDTLLDVVATNGWHYAPYTDTHTRLFVCKVGGLFVEESALCNLNNTYNTRGLATLDYDNDGDRDLVIFGKSDPLKMYRNDLSGTDIGWLRIDLDTSCDDGLAPHGIGARLSASFNGKTVYRWMHAGSNFLAMSELSVHFGLGAAKSIDELRVEWQDGTTTVLLDVSGDRTIVISACDPRCPGDLTTTGSAGGSPEFGTPDGTTDLSDLLYFVNVWSTDIGPNPGSQADLTTTGSSVGGATYGQPDGSVDLSDLLYYVNQWNGGLTACE